MTPKLLLLVVGVVALCACSLAPIFVHAQSTSHFLNATLLAASATSGAQFGYALAISDSLVVVGAYGYNASQGAAYVYSCDTTTTTCTQGEQLMAKDSQQGDHFGSAVAMSGSLVVVGAPNKNSNRGEAYMFSCTSATSCSQGQILLAFDGDFGDSFGNAVAISGTLVAVGAYEKTIGNNGGQGGVYLFSCTSDGSSCSAGQNLSISDGAANDFFGYSVAMSGTTLAVGAYGRSTNQGAAYLFSCSADGASCTLGQQLAVNVGPNDMLGYAMAMSGSQVLVGAPGVSVGTSSRQGVVYVFACSNASSCTPGMQVTAIDGAANDGFGWSVAMFNNLLVVTANNAAGTYAQGVVYLFSCTSNGPSCTQGSELSATDKTSQGSFGSAVAIFGSNPAMVVVGVPTDSAHNDQGEAIMFVAGSDGACECSAGWTGVGCDTCTGSCGPTASPTTPTNSPPPIPSASATAPPATAPPATSTPTHNAAGSVATSIFTIAASAVLVLFVVM